MSSMGIQRSPQPPIPAQNVQRQNTQRLQSAPAPSRTTSTSPTQVSNPAHRLQQQQVQARSQQSTQLHQLTSPETAQAVSQAIDQTAPTTLMQNARQCAQVLGDSRLTQGLVTTGKTAITTGAKLHDFSESVNDKLDDLGVAEPLGEVVESLTEKFKMGETEIPTAEAALFEQLTGISTDTMGSLKEMVETGQQALQVAKTAQCLNEAYQSYGTPEFGGKVEALAKASYVTLGGDSTIELTKKVSAFCEKCDVDSGKEVMSALAKFSTDDSLVATGQRSALSWMSTATVGSGVTGYVGKAMPFLSYGALAIDTGMAAKTGYDWWQGKASSTELCKSTVTALGSAAGATVAPVIGPLAASAINYGIDGASSAYSAVSNWWYGSSATA